jgi:hypothetical protein
MLVMSRRGMVAKMESRISRKARTLAVNSMKKRESRTSRKPLTLAVNSMKESPTFRKTLTPLVERAKERMLATTPTGSKNMTMVKNPVFKRVMALAADQERVVTLAADQERVMTLAADQERMMPVVTKTSVILRMSGTRAMVTVMVERIMIKSQVTTRTISPDV